ncbi:MAG: hypothetical protein Q9220_004272 [cf. Caloplaca sp. 1 TL-2023]
MSIHPTIADTHPASDQLLSSTLAASAYSFLQPTPALHAATLVLAKRYLDPLALSATEAQAERLQALKRKRKRGQDDQRAFKRPFHLRQVHLEGLRTQQIWEQARRVLDASTDEVEASLQDFLPSVSPISNQDLHLGNGHWGKSVKFADDQNNLSKVAEHESDDTATSEEVDDEAPPDMVMDEDLEDDLEAPDGIDEEVERISGEEIDLDEESQATSDLDADSPDTFVADKHGLNDGFFSIDDFNKQTDFLEDQDARGETRNESSDEEEIDWASEPQPLLEDDDELGGEDESDADGDDKGPTFGNADLNAEDTDSDVSDDLMPIENMGASSNTNDIMYADFFAPPARRATKSTRMRALPKTQPPRSSAQAPEDDINRTIAAVRRDIFEDDNSASEDSAAEADTNPDDPRSSRRSNHERRQAKLVEEIRRLEAASVAKRDWTLSGEARAADRPMNSLLEEDLEFERAGKPVPVITNEVSEDIEALIKLRIINREFDEVIRRRPGSLATSNPERRRGRFELDDTKPQQSLAEMYEADHLKQVDPAGYVDKRDAKLKREHQAIEALWADISNQLDTLSNWHYKPKPPEASITVVSDVPKISMEDARPAAAEGMGMETSMLAPQEIYKPGEERSRADKAREVVLSKSGAPVAREEMTREQKLRRRRREKERIRKQGGSGGSSGNVITASAPPKETVTNGSSRKKVEKNRVVGELKKGGVRVIGRRGELVDVEGNAAKGATNTGGGGGGSFKL